MNKNILSGIDTVILRVSDIERSRLWYLEKLGFRSLHQDELLKLVVLDTFGPTSLTLWETDEKIVVDPQTASYPIFSTQDAQGAHQALRSKAVKVGELITDHVVTYFTFQDPDGNVLEVCQVHS